MRLKRDLVELRRAARLYHRHTEAVYSLLIDNEQLRWRLTDALRKVGTESKGPLTDFCQALHNNLDEHFSEAFTGADKSRDAMRGLCDLLGVRS